MSKTRGFEVVEDWARKYPESEIKLPRRSTEFSAGYDFVLAKDVEIQANSSVLFWTDVKAYMKEDEHLAITIRSSLGINKGLYLLNQVGIIDCDYYGNEKNDGNIGMGIRNSNPFPVVLKKGEKIAQGRFLKYFITDDDQTFDKRNGGIGSTNK
ncbi:MAG: dUTP diphosphatase [bacterium]